MFKARVKKGDTVLRLNGRRWVKAVIVSVDPRHASVPGNFVFPIRRIIHQRSVHLSRRAATAARQHRRVWGAGMAAPAHTQKVERCVIGPHTADHLMDWIFNHDRIEVCTPTRALLASP